MEIYFLRHGETQWNRERRIQGSTPYTDLTEFGVKLAELTRDGFRASAITFDAIYSSPLKRALHTAQIVADGAPIVTDKRLIEMDFGKYEGTSIVNGKYTDDNIKACFEDVANYIPPEGAESIDDVVKRLFSFIDEVFLPLENLHKRILVVAHGGVMRALLYKLGHLALEGFWQNRQPNCCVHILKVTNGTIEITEEAKTFYDEETAKNLPAL